MAIKRGKYKRRKVRDSTGAVTNLTRIRTRLPNGRRIDNETAKQLQAVKTLIVSASTLGSRATLFRSLGRMYGDTRDIYDALGWKKTLLSEDYLNKYIRQDIAKRIIDAYPKATWRGEPTVTDDDDPHISTDFEKAWQELVNRLHLYNRFTRADRLCGLDHYSVLYLGLQDSNAAEPHKEPENVKELLYVQPYSYTNATIKTWDDDKTSPRFGLPESYELKIRSVTADQAGISAILPADSQTVTTSTMIVHWKRVIHIAEDVLESDIWGRPRLESIYNRLDGLELIAGASPEAHWRGAFPGFSFERDADVDMDDQDESDLEAEIQDYVHGLNRFLNLRGVNTKVLKPGLAGPKEAAELQIDLIAGATGIPKRILMGSERGELASSTDQENWNARVAERRRDFGEPCILRAFIDRCIELGVLPKPKVQSDTGESGYQVIWPDLEALSEKEQVEIAKAKTAALKAWFDAGLDAIIPADQFLTKFLMMDELEVESLLEDIQKMIDEEEDEPVVEDEDEDEDEDEEE